MEGSYFGDQDCLRDLMRSTSKKFFRDSTAEAKVTSDVMVIKKRELDEHLRLF